MLAQSTAFAPILVVGPVADDDERADLAMFAKDVSAELGCSATVADSLDFDVREFAAVVVDQDYLSSVTASVLWIEAVEAGVPVIEPQAPALAARCDACSQLQTITTVRDTSGGITEVLCATCDGRASGCCSWCLEEGPTTPIHDGAGTWAPLCKWCAKECKRRARRRAGGRRPVAAGCAA